MFLKQQEERFRHMKICLINPLIQQSQWENDIAAKWPPLGLAYIAAVLEKQGHIVKILERRLLAGTKKRTPEYMKEIDKLTVKEIKDFEPNIVGITATTPLIMDAFHTARIIKDINDSILVVAGGAHPTAEPITTLEQCSDIDIVCQGEGELVMLDLANQLPLSKINGITYRMNGQVISTPKREVINNLDELPLPARHLLNQGFYFTPNSALIRGFYFKGTTIIAARGCPFQCAFCQSHQMAMANKGKYLRFRSPESVVKEIEHLVDNCGVEGILFAEDIFSLNRPGVKKICELLQEKGLSKKIKYAVNLRVDTVDKDLLRLLKDSGCVRVIYGCESGSQRTLEILKKKTTVEKNLEAVKLTKEAGITCEANMMVSLPGEKKEDLIKTIKFLKKSKPDRINRGKFYPIPGTFFYQQLLEQRIIQKPDNWDIFNDKYVSGNFTFADMPADKFRKMKDKMDREIVLPTNYKFAVKTAWKANPLFALQQSILMILHTTVLYFPSPLQEIIKKIAEKVRVKSRYVFK
jgi:radical SAM superfamily enzyme YgiQ (UPF0313 family)